MDAFEEASVHACNAEYRAKEMRAAQASRTDPRQSTDSPQQFFRTND